MLNNIIKKSIASMIIGLTLSIGLHDSHLDKATLIAVTPPNLSHVATEAAQINVHLHTHSERGSIKEAAHQNNPNPHRHARFRERKHMKNKHHQDGGRMTPMTMPV